MGLSVTPVVGWQASPEKGGIKPVTGEQSGEQIFLFCFFAFVASGFLRITSWLWKVGAPDSHWRLCIVKAATSRARGGYASRTAAKDGY